MKPRRPLLSLRLAQALILSMLVLDAFADEVAPGIYRTPDARFANLKDFPYAPNYEQIGDYRIHYVDEGPRDAAPILLLHGEPTWSYLYRKMIPVLTAAGHRVIAPDLIGFGRSDKPSDEGDYSYSMQVDAMLELVHRLDLENVTFFGQDWGGLVGLRVVAADPDRFARVVVSNTGLPAASGLQGWFGYTLFKLSVWWTGPLTMEELRAETTFPRWVAYSYYIDELPIGELLGFMGGDETVRAAYEAPFPDRRYKAGAQIMPYIVPSQLSENEQVWQEVFDVWDKPFLVAFSDSDPISAGGEQVFLNRVPTAQNVTIEGAGHFVQEDAGPELAALINDFIAGREVRGFSVDTSAASASEIERIPNRQALFGDLHVHTSWSTDAYSGGNRVGPADAYRFARGEMVTLPTGLQTQLATPLDFVALTDHAEGFDVIEPCTYADNPQYDSEACRTFRDPDRNPLDYFRIAFERGTSRPAQRNPLLCADEEQCKANARATWERVQAVANEFDEPGRFTALMAYEFSALLSEFGMLHRNVIFRGEDVIPHAISSMDVAGQADFFRQLDAACTGDCEVLTIPHNTNYSWGLMFSRTDEDGSEYTPEDIERRARIDRLVEITQQKGNSECQIGVGAADEDCDFGNLFPVCVEGQAGRCARESSFLRNALLDGIQIASEGGRNPFKYGIVGATDTHNSDPGNTSAERRSRYAAALGNAEAVQQVLQAAHPVVGPIRRTSVGGLAGVWAEANTRADIFDALRRREAFATSGSRIRMRFFAGDLPALEDAASAVAMGYERGVPMGADLPKVDDPTFWVWAVQDPMSATLDRIQVVKGWVENGEKRQSVRDVVCSGDRTPGADGRCPPTSASVDTSTCERLDESGASELRASFKDPDFDAAQEVFYYVRVLENPSCRWTTWLANSADVAIPDDLPATEQQRAWSSPIWVRGI